MHDLDLALSEHFALPFPSEIEKGRDYGRVDPVMIDSDIYGWARAASDGRLGTEGAARVRQARAELAASLRTMPDSALGYYQSLLRLADAALAETGEGS